jgi:radical SAM superfamily enzyme YgiQ (UPF0313 family)
MKIRLIEPRPAGLNVFDQALLPRLGLPLIGRLLANEGHDVRIYVEHLTPINWRDVLNADLVGFSATTTTAPAAYALAASVRQAGVPTVIGGSHVTFLPDEALDHCDYVVRGEGQKTALELAKALDGKENLSGIAGLSYWDAQDGAPHKRHNSDRPPCSQDEFAALPPPDLSLIVGHERMTNVPIMTQWGCPFDCDFCGVIAMFGRKVRARPVEDVLDELETYRDRGTVFFYDDNFVVDKARTRRLLRGMIERDLKLSWSAQVCAEVVYADRRIRQIDHELLKLMRDSGCGMVYVGFESANPETLRLYNKHQTIETMLASIRAFRAHGIKVHGMFVVGSDADDAASIASTVDFAIENEIDTVQFMILTPCPGTPFYKRLVAQGRLLTQDWSLFDGHHCVIQPARMSPYELQLSAYKAMARFYSARRAWRMIGASVLRNLPFLLGLARRETRLSRQLPRIALLSLIPSRRPDVPRILNRALSRPSRERLESMFLVPALRLYARRHIRLWAQQARSRAHIEFLRRLMPERPGSVTGAS